MISSIQKLNVKIEVELLDQTTPNPPPTLPNTPQKKKVIFTVLFFSQGKHYLMFSHDQTESTTQHLGL